MARTLCYGARSEDSMFGLLLSASFAGAPPVLDIVVQDGSEKPVPNAVVRFESPAEGDNHCVNTFDGSWSGSAVYLRGFDSPTGLVAGEEVAFAPGMDVRFTVFAPGYATVSRTVVLKGKTSVVVALKPEDGARRPALYGDENFCGVPAEQRKLAADSVVTIDATDASCGTTVVARGDVGGVRLSLAAPTDGSRWTRPFVTDPAVLRMGLEKVEAGALKDLFAFSTYGESTILVDRVGSDGSVAGTCEIRAIMRPSPE